MKLRLAAAMMLVCIVPAHASHKHHHRTQEAVQCVPDNSGHMDCSGAEKRAQRVRIEADANGNDALTVGSRPHGCPYQFCGCEASLYLFGKIVPSLNLASNWIRKFPRAHPAPGMAAARNHHVMVLIHHVSGRDWLVHDGNSGHHVTHEHIRSITGFVIVDPRPRLALQ